MICIYVCMHVCMYVCMHVCMYVRMYVVLLLCILAVMSCQWQEHVCICASKKMMHVNCEVALRSPWPIMRPLGDGFRFPGFGVPWYQAPAGSRPLAARVVPCHSELFTRARNRARIIAGILMQQFKHGHVGSVPAVSGQGHIRRKPTHASQKHQGF